MKQKKGQKKTKMFFFGCCFFFFMTKSVGRKRTNKEFQKTVQNEKGLFHTLFSKTANKRTEKEGKMAEREKTKDVFSNFCG